MSATPASYLSRHATGQKHWKKNWPGISPRRRWPRRVGVISSARKAERRCSRRAANSASSRSAKSASASWLAPPSAERTLPAPPTRRFTGSSPALTPVLPRFGNDQRVFSIRPACAVTVRLFPPALLKRFNIHGKLSISRPTELPLAPAVVSSLCFAPRSRSKKARQIFKISPWASNFRRIGFPFQPVGAARICAASRWHSSLSLVNSAFTSDGLGQQLAQQRPAVRIR